MWSAEEFYNSKLLWITFFVVSIYLYLKWVVFGYWKRLGVPYEEPIVPVGNLYESLVKNVSFGDFFKRSYMKSKHFRYYGIYMFHQPHLVITDPELIRLVLNKEFSHFPDRGLYLNEKVDPVSAHLFLLGGEKWKNLRSKFSPSFTSGKMKQMFFVMTECAEELAKCLDDTAKISKVVDIKDIIIRYTMDIISSAAFGLNSNSLKDPNNGFHYYGEKTFRSQPMRNLIVFFAPSLAYLVKLRFLEKSISDFFIRFFSDVVKMRKEKNIIKKDFLNELMQLIDRGYTDDDEGNPNKPKSSTGALTMLEGTAQAFLIFVAGFETSSSTVSFCMYELALHPEIQDKLCEEIDVTLKKHGSLSYDSLTEMTYLQKVVSETLRKYPPVPMLNRICTKDCDLPSMDLHISKGMKLIIPVVGLHYDSNIYPDPDKFDPERFSPENVASRNSFTYLPFGEGPRFCIGNRFGLMQVKVALVTMLSRYRFSVCDKTEIPITYSPGVPVQRPRNGIYLEIKAR
ncbi:probable cytochrome P450 6a14 [Orussus abietinus]|uniref:probable cytochrome P450 6a14 n=1 Tax=Orussus abietinus TaxID=222816 RepID=UPI00062628D4|nr:probable cytochrome P450 6a14 [Orussus abietinus]